jgi:hypothetical protein
MEMFQNWTTFIKISSIHIYHFDLFET